MTEPIVVTIAHSLGAAEARARIQQGLDRGKSDFSAIFSSFDTVWTGDHADVTVVALAQKVVTAIDVQDQAVRLAVQLPWYFAPLQQKIATMLRHQGEKTLQLTHG